MRLKDKVIIVTGGAGLIGRAFCEAISNNGGIAVIADINFEEAKKVSSTIKNSYPIHLDICSKQSILDTISQLKSKFSSIDGLVNNAYPRNKNYGKEFMDVEYDDFCENLNINLGGYFLTSQQLFKYFMEAGSGNIVNISSIYGVVPPKFEIYEGASFTMPVEYAVIKSGLIHLTKYMAKYGKNKNIRVNTISPGGVFNNQPVKFVEKYKSKCLNQGMLLPEDLLGGLVFLLSDESKMVNGQNLIIDDGFTL